MSVPDPAPVVEGRDDRRVGTETVDLVACCSLLASVLREEGVPPRAEASVVLVDVDDIAALNEEHLGHVGPTDVLSFPLDGSGPVPEDEPWVVGDVVLCPQVASAQASGHAGDLAAELALLVTHGGLHLCGWDHADPDQEAVMWARERELLDRLHGPLPADPWAGNGAVGSGPAGSGAIPVPGTAGGAS